MTEEHQLADSPEEEFRQTEWVYIGQRIYSGKRRFVWAEVSDLDCVYTFPKQFKTAAIGAIFSVWMRGTSFVTSGPQAPQFVRNYPDPEQRQFWAVRDEETRQMLAMKAMEVKAAKADPLEPLLIQIGQLARYLKPAEKRALLARIVERIFTM